MESLLNGLEMPRKSAYCRNCKTVTYEWGYQDDNLCEICDDFFNNPYTFHKFSNCVTCEKYCFKDELKPFSECDSCMKESLN